MDDQLYFTEQHLAVREMVRQFARDEVAPVAARHDADGSFPWETVKKMGELGLLGVPWPESLGGAGLDLLSYVMTIEELARVDRAHGVGAHDARHLTDRQLRHRRAAPALRSFARQRQGARRVRADRAERRFRCRRHADDRRPPR